MLDGSDLGSIGQDLGEVAAPECQVLAISQAPNLRGRQDAFDATTHAACRLRRGRPDRFDYLQHEVGIDVSHGHVAEDGIGVGGEGIAPLLFVLAVLPAGLVGFDKLLGAFLEGCRPCLCESFLGCCSVSLLDGVFPLSRCWRASLAFWRASERDTAGKLPSPMSRALPSRLKRKTHDLEPVADACR